MINRACRAAVLFAATLLLGAAPSVAWAQLAGLNVNGDTLYIIKETKKGGKVSDKVKLKVKSNDRLLAIDVRAADGELYGLSSKSNIYKIDPKTGSVEKLFSLGTKFKGVVSMDCNPVADACRIVSDKGLNARFTFAAKTLIVDPELSFASSSKKPRVIAIGYTNSFAGAKTTELFDIDAETDGFYEQDPPNSGVLNPIAKIRPKVEKPLAFDIISFGEGQNTGLAVYQKQIYIFDFSSGVLSDPIKVKGLDVNLADVAFLQSTR
ncbi:DUF4394 domain-containing protein [Methylopila sp. M107]|uniref:DUF4394 domain-containing protein n=1 Tax=Methylopila sp. M107 TaxID=1101190 RepID=UPI00036FB00D|nr:DUF4394 domain-containing protein [Methylopila sp. M107]